MDVGADNFRFTLEDQNGRKLPTQTIRQPKTTELHIDSLDRYLPSMLATTTYFTNYPNNQVVAKLAGPNLLLNTLNSTGYAGGFAGVASNPMVIQTSRPLSYGYYSRVALTQFFLKMQQPTILNSYNAKFALYIGTAPGTITTQVTVYLPSGFYTYASMATVLQAALRALPGNPLPAATVTAPTLPGDGFIIATGDPAVYIAASMLAPTGTGEQGLIESLRLGRNLGFSRAVYGFAGTFNTGGQPVGPPTLGNTLGCGPPNFLCTDYVDIVSSSLTNYKDAKDTNSSLSAPNAVLGRIWLTENAVDIAGSGAADDTQIGSAPISLVKTWVNPNWCQWSPNQSVDKIDIQLLDMFGQPLYWSSQANTEWSATLTLTE